MSMLFFFGDRVLKLKKAVVYPFADLSDLARRRADCEREVALNCRLAPDVYLGTATVSLGGEPLEYGVLMRRLPEGRSLEQLVLTHADVDDELAAIAGALAAFHAGAQRSTRIDAAATPAALWQRWQATGEALGRFAGTLFDRSAYRDLTRLARRVLESRSQLFDGRIAEGAICDGHGDLQASDIFCLPDGPRLIDCMEFDDELRYGDVLLDAAFLAEDLERLGARDLADAFLALYRRQAGSERHRALEHFYIAVRAHVRLLVTCLRLEQGIGKDRREPARVLRLADEHLHAALPRVLLVGGPPGSGKSTLAHWLGKLLDADVLSTDRLRRPGSGGASRFDDAAREAVYAEMLGVADRLVGAGHSVVLDATWQSSALRVQARALARARAAEVLELRVDCPSRMRTDRVRARVRRSLGDSEATVEVAKALAAREDPWPDAHGIDSSGTVEQTRGQAARLLKVPLPDGAVPD